MAVAALAANEAQQLLVLRVERGAVTDPVEARRARRAARPRKPSGRPGRRASRRDRLEPVPARARLRSPTCSPARRRGTVPASEPSRPSTRCRRSPRPASPAAAATPSSSPSSSSTSNARASPARAALDDQLEHPVELGLAADRPRDRRGRLEPSDGPLQLVAALRARRSYRRALSIAIAAQSARTTSGCSSLSVNPRRPPCRSGRGCRRPRRGRRPARRGRSSSAGGRAGSRTTADARSTSARRSGSRVLDQHAEHAAAARQVADRAARLVVDADRQEALELALVLVEDPERRVARAGELARRLAAPARARPRGRAPKPVRVLRRGAERAQLAPTWPCAARLPRVRSSHGGERVDRPEAGGSTRT